MSGPLVGLVPAAGSALRVAPLPCSKELFPVAFRLGEGTQSPRPLPVCCYLLEALAQGGAARAYVVLRSGKWDIPAYLEGGEAVDLPLSYLVLHDSPGVPYTIDRAYPFVRDATVLFGFPDMVLEPRSVFATLLRQHEQHASDVTLGLFAAERPEKMDLVATGRGRQVRRIEVKPAATSLTKTWIVATWGPVFTEFLHDAVASHASAPAHGDRPELHVGHVLQAAIDAGISVRGVSVRGGRYRDIGTPDDLAAAWASGTEPLR